MKKIQFGDFEVLQIASRFYRLVYNGRTDKAILMTGSDVTKSFDVPFPFILQRIHLYHMDSSYAACTDELQITLRRPKGGILELEHFIDDFYKKTDITDAKAIVSFEDLGEEGGLIFEPTTIQMILNSTSTDLVQAIVYIKELK